MDLLHFIFAIIFLPVALLSQSDREPAPEEFIFSEPISPELAEINRINSMANSLLPARVNVRKDFSEHLQLVTYNRDGYILEIPSYIEISAWGDAKEFLRLSDNRNVDHPASVNIQVKNSSVQELFEENVISREEYAKDIFIILRHELKKISESGINVEAYIEHYEDNTFGYDPTIFVQDTEKTFVLESSGVRYPESDLLMIVLKGFKLNS